MKIGNGRLLLTIFDPTMTILDVSIANVSVPHIAGNLGISLDQGTWIITSYAVGEAITVPLTGWLAGRLARSRAALRAMTSQPRNGRRVAS